jgi:hypothetical protein
MPPPWVRRKACWPEGKGEPGVVLLQPTTVTCEGLCTRHHDEPDDAEQNCGAEPPAVPAMGRALESHDSVPSPPDRPLQHGYMA